MSIRVLLFLICVSTFSLGCDCNKTSASQQNLKEYWILELGRYDSDGMWQSIDQIPCESRPTFYEYGDIGYYRLEDGKRAYLQQQMDITVKSYKGIIER